MDRTTAIDRLRSHRDELEALGIKRLSIFGSVARGDNTAASDVDLVAELNREDFRIGLIAFGRMERRLAELLEADVDLLSEPVSRNPRIQANIDKDRIRVF